MRNRKVFVVAGFIVAWLFLTYYFIMKDDMELPRRKTKWANKLAQLEQGARREFGKSHQNMVNMLGILQSKYTETKPPEIGIIGLAEPPADVVAEDANAHDDVNANSNNVQEAPETTTPKLTLMERLPSADRLANDQPVIPILVFGCNRVSISKCLDNLIKYRPNSQQFPIIVSQDCGDEATRKMILSYKDQLTLIEQPDLSDIVVPPKEKKFKGYYKIARHYGWALNTTFQRGYEFMVIVEDDLNVAPDFYEYFLGTHMLLKQDSTLWCVSAWNDNGKENFIDATQPQLLYRTDFFPGLGWMLTRELWQELSVKWPKSFWDDWIRNPEQRKNRVCIRPEISRTRTFGKIGVSNGLFYDKHLKYIKLSEEFVPFTKMNLSYLLKDNYDRTFLKEIYTYPIVTYDELRRSLISKEGPVRIQYTSREQYKRITKMLGLMDDFKSGVPRTAYHGIVSFHYNGRRVHLAPNVNWKGYDLSWS